MFLQLPLLGMIGTTELVLIVAVALLLFGGKKIPELMRGLGAGVKSFKDGMKEGEAPTTQDKASASQNASSASQDKAGEQKP